MVNCEVKGVQEYGWFRMMPEQQPILPKIGFIFWAQDRIGGMERRYSRLASYLMSVEGCWSVLAIVQGRCRAAVLSFFYGHQKNRVINFGASPKKRRLFILSSVIELLHLAYVVRVLKFQHLHLCLNPGVISFFVALLAPHSTRLTLSMVDSTYDRTSTRFSRSLAALNLSRYDGVDCLSAGPRDYILNYFPHFNKEKLHVAPCSFSDYSSAAPQDCRDIDLVMMARFVTGKGYELLMQDVGFFDKYELHCYGSGPLRVEIGRAHVGFASSPYQVLGRSKIFLSLQQNENYPSQALLEAMASGCAIIATDVGETRRILDESCAVLIPFCLDSLKSAIEKLLNDDDLRCRMGHAARSRALQHHTIERYSKYFLDEVIG